MDSFETTPDDFNEDIDDPELGVPVEEVDDIDDLLDDDDSGDEDYDG